MAPTPHQAAAARDISPALRREVLNANCAYCGGPFPTEVDHVIPVSRGGTGERSNLAAACTPCNRQKLDSTPEEWRAWCVAEGKPWPPKGRHGYVRDAVQEVLALYGMSAEDLESELARLAAVKAAQ